MPVQTVAKAHNGERRDDIQTSCFISSVYFHVVNAKVLIPTEMLSMYHHRSPQALCPAFSHQASHHFALDSSFRYTYLIVIVIYEIILKTRSDLGSRSSVSLLSD